MKPKKKPCPTCSACHYKGRANKVNDVMLCAKCQGRIENMMGIRGLSFMDALRTLRLRNGKNRVVVLPGCFEMGKRR